MLTATGWSPGGRPAGTITLSCASPAKPGASPLYVTSEFFVPIVTVTDALMSTRAWLARESRPRPQALPHPAQSDTELHTRLPGWASQACVDSNLRFESRCPIARCLKNARIDAAQLQLSSGREALNPEKRTVVYHDDFLLTEGLCLASGN